MKLKTFPIFLAFLVMGVADAMGPMSSYAQTAFHLSNVMSKLLPFFVYFAFAIFSLPGGMFAARLGKKKLLLIGLALNIVGVGVPAFWTPTFPVLLACIFILGVGTTFLQVAGNPIMRDVSSEGAYSRNLAMAQGIKGVGSGVSTWVIPFAILLPFLAGLQWRAAFPIYFVLMVVTFIAVASLKIQETKAEKPPGFGASIGLLTEPIFFFAVLGIFLYVGSEICMSSGLQTQLNHVGIQGEWANWLGPVAFYIALTVSRLVAGSINVNAHTFFRISAVMGLVGLGLILCGNMVLTVTGAIVAGLGFGNIWPMLFAITVEERPERANELSGLMCMAIAGGALLPLLMGKLVDLKWGAMAFLVPSACFVYLLLLSLKGGKKTTPAPTAANA